MKSSGSPGWILWRRRSAVAMLSATRLTSPDEDVGDAAQLLQYRGVRDEDHVVLVLAHARLALARRYADHGKWLFGDPDDLADRVLVGRKQLIPYQAAEHRHLRRGGDVLRREEGAFLDLPRANQREVDVGALHLGIPVLVAGDDLAARVGAGGDVLHARQLGDRD